MALRLLAAGVLTLAAGTVGARTLTLTAQRLHNPHASAQTLRMVVAVLADAGSLQLSIARLDVPELALSGQVDWSCKLVRSASGSRICTGPIEFKNDAGSAQTAEFAVQMVDQGFELALTRDRSRVVLTIPLAGDEPLAASLQRVPADWLKVPLALVWKGGKLRDGIFDAQVSWQAGARIDASYSVTNLLFNTLDGSFSGSGLASSGHLTWTPVTAGAHIVSDAQLTAGSVQAGTLHVRLPPTPVEANLDATLCGDGHWQIARFAWRDPEALAFEASGELDPSALAPLRSLTARIHRAVFPLTMQRYAADALAARGLEKFALEGELAGEISVDEQGWQHFALTTDALDLKDADLFFLKGLRGGIDWSAGGERPPMRLAWKSARIAGTPISAVSARWQSKEGALHLLDPLRTKFFGGTLQLGTTVLDVSLQHSPSARGTFALDNLGYDSKDGALAAAKVAASGQFVFSANAGLPRLQLQSTFRGGEFLGGPVYVKLPSSPVKATFDTTLIGAQWRVDRFDWDDPGVLTLSAHGDIAPADAHPLHALQLDLRKTNLGPALQRYAHSWLASKGYSELEGDGSITGALQFDSAGLQRFAFSAHAINLRDGSGRFTVSGIDGDVDWRLGSDSAATTLGWKSLDLFRIPLGAASAHLQSHDGAIVLAQSLGVNVLGGKVQLEKLSLEPRSPRGERYAASFAIVGIDMAQLSTALGWPRFGGNLSGGIPQIELVGDTIELHGGLDLYVFDGHIGVSGVSLERPFGVAPSLRADVHFENLDLDPMTRAFSFGGMSGRLDGSVGNLRLVDWSPVAFDARLHTSGGGRMSYKAVKDLTSIGGGGGLSSSLQTMALKLFDTFGYRRLGLRCRLRDEVCMMGGIDPLPADASMDSVTDGYTIVEGSGLPRIQIVGHRRRVDWPTLVRRLIEATQGQGPVIQ